MPSYEAFPLQVLSVGPTVPIAATARAIGIAMTHPHQLQQHSHYDLAISAYQLTLLLTSLGQCD